MSISYQPSDSAVQAASLKWQTLILKAEDQQIVTTFNTGTGAVVVNVNQPVAQSAASGSPNFIPGCQPVMQVLTAAGALRVLSAGPTVSGSTISATVTGLAATDAIVVHYVINEA